VNKKPFHFPQIDSRLSFLLIASFLVFAGLFTRYTNLSNPLLDFHPTRQLFGAIKARAYYVQQDQTIPDWQKEIARRQLQTEAVIEPPLIEFASAKLYALYGENTAFPRAMSATFWLIGALFLYKLSKNLTQSSFGSLYRSGDRTTVDRICIRQVVRLVWGKHRLSTRNFSELLAYRRALSL